MMLTTAAAAATRPSTPRLLDLSPSPQRHTSRQIETPPSRRGVTFTTETTTATAAATRPSTPRLLDLSPSPERHTSRQIETPLSRRGVTFTTETTYMFHVAHGGSAVPNRSGPPIGLAKSHFHVACTAIRPDRRRHRRAVQKFDPSERVALLKAAAYNESEIAAFCVDAFVVRKSRQDEAIDFMEERVRQKKRRAVRMLVKISGEVSDQGSTDDMGSTSKRQCVTVQGC
ncbi:hypothetical protein DYB36_010516 [Aphanomyces astaci]|uniref:Uncharacterized protein n=1 Tax=Aphanomyces astaci TaxID=112090 RepID=A0A397A8N5_APHAT|nr:hypothetical protein DYB36_010516 [Aphanomyces astaci]